LHIHDTVFFCDYVDVPSAVTVINSWDCDNMLWPHFVEVKTSLCHDHAM